MSDAQAEGVATPTPATPPVAPEPKLVVRGLPLDVYVEDSSKLMTVYNSISHYRAACRQCYSIILLAQAAGAKIEETDEEDGSFRVTPDTEKAKRILAELLDQPGKEFGYQLRQYVLTHLWPSAFSSTWDSVKRAVLTVWRSKDPEFTTATRGWLALQGTRRVAWFNRRGIGLTPGTYAKLNDHSLALRWDKEIGTLNFSVGRLDSGRYRIWKALRDKEDGFELGTIYLSDRWYTEGGAKKRKLIASVTYSRPAKEKELDDEATCQVSFSDDPEAFILLRGPGEHMRDTLSVVDVIAALKRSYARRCVIETHKAANGNPRAAWGNRKSWQHAQRRLDGNTKNRELLQNNYLHAWSRRIIDRSATWGCGQLVVDVLPNALFGHPWQWAEFEKRLRYKGDEYGMAVHVEEEADEEEAEAPAEA